MSFTFTTEYELGGWWNTNWLYRKNIIIKHEIIEDSLTNYPILIDITSIDLKNNAQPNGDDIVFTNNEGDQIFDHEIEYYDSSNGHLTAWVKIPTLSSNIDTPIYLITEIQLQKTCKIPQTPGTVISEQFYI